MPIKRVVSDTSPISNLAIIGRLDLLRRLHGTVDIPPAVHAELMRLRSAVAHEAIRNAINDGWIRVDAPPPSVVPIPGLHAGELECLALASQRPDTLLLIDEAEGRAAARRINLPISGAIGVLIAARLNGWVPSLKAELLSLRTQARFYIAPGLFVQAIEAVGEQP